VRVKWVFGDQIRTAELSSETSFKEEAEKLTLDHGAVTMTYRDDEDDVISMQTQEDLDAAVAFHRRVHGNSSTKSLRILLQPVARAQAPLSPPPTPPGGGSCGGGGFGVGGNEDTDNSDSDEGGPPGHSVVKITTPRSRHDRHRQPRSPGGGKRPGTGGKRPGTSGGAGGNKRPGTAGGGVHWQRGELLGRGRCSNGSLTALWRLSDGSLTAL
jgi:hypothetical protein